MKNLLLLSALLFVSLTMKAQTNRECILIDENWQFAFGHASDPSKDFNHGTEYFTYLTKASSIHNEGPYDDEFDDSNWKSLNLPHDWVVDLPFASTASHSHGYKTVGYQYPETSVGWYRKRIVIPAEDEGKHLALRFDGIFRDAIVWFNGFYLGRESSGYAAQVYDITEYIRYGEENIICVRADASIEEGWFYEGAGIYRHVWLEKMNPVHVAPFGTFIYSNMEAPYQEAEIVVETTVTNKGLQSTNYTLTQRLFDADGKEVATITCAEEESLLPRRESTKRQSFQLRNPHLWSLESPYLYTLITEVYANEKLVDSYSTTTGFRHIHFDPAQGFFLNGKHVKLKGSNNHQDHAGVGSAIPDALQTWRIRQLKSFGSNAYRASHNPMTPEAIDACDREGMLVIAENRLMGVNQEHIDWLERMIRRDRNHPSIILWSIGNEEWALEWKPEGTRIAATMREYVHRFDPTRPATAGLSGGYALLPSLDVIGYNYLVQNEIDRHHAEHPEYIALGSEETTGCGTRGIYFNDPTGGRMPSMNRTGVAAPGKEKGEADVINVIERGWKYYDERPWLAGLFYWTGFDYRGEPNPLKHPATGSQFGLIDYCGFYKDETYYLKSWWNDEPVLHVFPHWNWQGKEGDIIDVWVYSNCEEVELLLNGKKLGRKTMEKNSHLSWQVSYQPGKLVARGYKNGKKIMEQAIETTGQPARIELTADRPVIAADNRDVAVYTLRIVDKKERLVPTACMDIDLKIDGAGRILGAGNGDSAYSGSERPTDCNAREFRIRSFNGLAQILVQAGKDNGVITLTAESGGLTAKQSICCQ